MKMSEIKELSSQELLERLDNEKSMLVKMKLNHAISPLDNPMKIKFTRKNIARIQTELRKREFSSKSNS
ncbi:MAG: 50S ribosomal protein L29 [Bacteroidales bacterium]|jgi:large subunit ribosomal protein L29|nr:50S ribosomal protein L29 [Bacteroidales bacterium]